VDDVVLDREVAEDELRRVGVVGQDAAHLGRCEDHVPRPLGLEEGPHRRLILEVQLGMRAQDDVAVTRLLQPPHQRRAHQPAMTRHEHLVVRTHTPPPRNPSSSPIACCPSPIAYSL
jgi:hypothetical protein